MPTRIGIPSRENGLALAPLHGGTLEGERFVGTWGPGLYSDDFAADLRTMVGTVSRLPLSGDEIVALLQDPEPGSAAPDDEDYTTFWLVVADQLHRRGIGSTAYERALAIIDDGSPDGADAGMDRAGWGCCVVVAADHALGYLAWYAVQRDLTIEPERPTLPRAVERLHGRPFGPGTLSKVHLRRMGWEHLGSTEVPQLEPLERDDIMQVVGADISISNVLCRWVNQAE